MPLHTSRPAADGVELVSPLRLMSHRRGHEYEDLGAAVARDLCQFEQLCGVRFVLARGAVAPV
jgi:hypothetical protein